MLNLKILVCFEIIGARSISLAFAYFYTNKKPDNLPKIYLEFAADFPKIMTIFVVISSFESHKNGLFYDISLIFKKFSDNFIVAIQKALIKQSFVQKIFGF